MQNSSIFTSALWFLYFTIVLLLYFPSLSVTLYLGAYNPLSLSINAL